jgi:hypothetical protein
MPSIINEELIQLASEFRIARLSGRSNWFSRDLWRKAISIATKFSISEVCEAIKISPNYFQKKIRDLAEANDKPLTFVEVAHQACIPANLINVQIERCTGEKIKIDGLSMPFLTQVINQFLRQKAI